MTTEQKIEALGKAYSVLAADCEQWKARAETAEAELAALRARPLLPSPRLTPEQNYEAAGMTLRLLERGYCDAKAKLAIAVEALELIANGPLSVNESVHARAALAKIKGEE